MGDDEPQRFDMIKVQFDKEKFRLYRLPKKIYREKNNLWRAKYEVGRRITDLMKRKRAQIAELNKQVKLLEKTHAHWAFLAKSLNSGNEDFFLDVVVASDEDIEAFEQDNFFTSSSWAKPREISELTDDELAELLGLDEEDDGDGKAGKVDHYSWICHQIDGTVLKNHEKMKIAKSDTRVPQKKKDLPKAGDVNKKQPVKDKKSDSSPSPLIEKVEPANKEKSVETISQPHESVQQELVESLKPDAVKAAQPEAGSNVEQVEKVDVNTAALQKSNELSEKEPQTPISVEEEKETEEVVSAPPKSSPADETVENVNVNVEKANDLNPIPEVVEEKVVDIIKSEVDSEVEKETDGTKEPEPNTGEKDLKSEKDDAKEERNEPKLVDIKPNDEEKEPDTKKEEIQAAPATTSNESQESSPALSISSQNEQDWVKPEKNQNNQSASDVDISSATTTTPPDTKSSDISSVSDLGESLDLESQQSASSPKQKKKLADPSGYSKLRLTSGSSGKDETPAPPPPVKRSGNIWQQRAAEREEKLDAERKTSSSHVTAYPALSPLSLTASNQPFKPAFSLVKKDAVQKTARVETSTQKHSWHHSNGEPAKAIQMAKPAQVAKEPTKKVDSNGWITPIVKKGKHTGSSFLKTKQEAYYAPQTTNKEEKEIKKAPAPPPTSEVSKKATESAASDPVVKEVLKEEKPDIKDDSIQEKRAERRQRVREKAKQSAKQNKEEEKKARELKRIEHEKMIEEEKKKKQEKQQKEWQQRRHDIMLIKEERESYHNSRRAAASSNENFEEMIEVRNRLTEHTESRGLEYRLIESKVYLDKRINDLKLDPLTIGDVKQKTLERYRNRIITNEAINTYLVFVSERLEQPTSNFKEEDLIDYMSDMAHNIAYGPENKNFLQRAIFSNFQEYCSSHRLKDSDNIMKSIHYMNVTLKRLADLPDRTPEQCKIVRVLTNYSTLHRTAQEYIDTTSYLYTRMRHQYFVLEEDYLLTCGDKSSNSINEVKKTAPTAEERSEEEDPQEKMEVDGDDDEDEETIEVIDMSCQTDHNGEPVDLLALSKLPRSPDDD